MFQKSAYQKRYWTAATVALLLTCFVAFIMLDTFVFEDASAPLSTPVPTSTAQSGTAVTPTPEPVQLVSTDTEYNDGDIHVKIETVKTDKVVYHVADIQLSDVQYLKSAFAKGKYGRNITESTSTMARNNNAIFAINGDYCGFRPGGIIIRNGALYRDTKYGEILAIQNNGDFQIIDDAGVTGQQLVDEGVLHTFAFGPALVIDGQYADRESSVFRANPRTGIGQAGPLHYVFIVVDGRTDDSAGLNLKDFAQLFIDRGCSVAYNLDGGGTSTMYMNGKVVNHPSYGSERRLSDILYIGK